MSRVPENTHALVQLGCRHVTQTIAISRYCRAPKEWSCQMEYRHALQQEKNKLSASWYTIPFSVSVSECPRKTLHLNSRWTCGLLNYSRKYCFWCTDGQGKDGTSTETIWTLDPTCRNPAGKFPRVTPLAVRHAVNRRVGGVVPFFVFIHLTAFLFCLVGSSLRSFSWMRK